VPFEETITVHLDPDTYEDIGPHGSGRWYNLPTAHPITGEIMEVPNAIAFALERGYLGAGYDTGEIAVGAAQYRANASSVSDSPIPPDIWDVPFNPGGRAVDGFKYSNLDGVLIHTGRLTSEGKLGEEEHSQELNVDLQMAARDAAMSETFKKGREMFDTLLSVGMEEILPKRESGSERSYTFRSSGGLRYSDNPATMIGEERVD
jgi:hypothetical protein